MKFSPEQREGGALRRQDTCMERMMSVVENSNASGYTDSCTRDTVHDHVHGYLLKLNQQRKDTPGLKSH